MSRRWRALRTCIKSPADAVLLARMTAWAPGLPVLKRVLPLPKLVALMAGRARGHARDPELERRIVRMARLVYRGRRGTFRDNCLERSLVTYRFLSRAGADPELVVAMSKSEQGLHGHVWVTVEGLPVHEDPAELEAYVPLMRFRRGALRRSAGSPAGPLPGMESGTKAKQ
jgi:transglutaminase superfamily protein